MIHIAVPETTKICDSSGATHNGFNIFVNGAYHCTLRYSALLGLHESLRRIYEWVNLIGFPPKRIKYFISERELEERRDALEFYLKTICQNPQTSYSPIVIDFFREAQRDSFLSSYAGEVDTHLAVYRLDGTKVLVHCTPGESTSTILQRLGDTLRMKSHLVKYFGMFIVAKSDVNQYKVVRWLQDFDCPSISLHTLTQCDPKRPLKIILRKAYWDIDIDKELVRDETSLKLIYGQAVSEIEACKRLKCFKPEACNKWSPPSDELLTKCKKLQEQGLAEDYVKLCQMQPSYGLMYFEDCLSDYPSPNTVVHLAFGNRQLFLLYKVADTAKYMESAFRVNRIRCWKLTNKTDNGTPRLSFEYLVARDHLEWITIYSEQSLLLSLCLQSMVNEIVQSRLNSTVPDMQPAKISAESLSHSSPSSSNSNSNNVSSTCSTTSSYESFNSLPSPASVTRIMKVKKLSTSFDNDAFNTITDDDL